MSEENKDYQLRLYITEKTEKSKKAIEKLEEMLEEKLDNYSLEVVDIMENPELAEEEKILATPMLEKKLPPPVRRIVGELSNQEKVLLGLDLVSNKD